MFYDMLTTQCNTNRKTTTTVLVSPVLAEIVLTITKTISRTWAAKQPSPNPEKKHSVPSVSARRRDSNDDDDLEMELVRENYGKCSDSKALQALGYEGMGEMPREIGSSSWFTYQSNCWRQELPQQQR